MPENKSRPTPLCVSAVPQHGRARRRACLLSASRIADDPRVRRQGDALAAAGWDVTAVGFGGARSPAPEWSIVGLPHPGEPQVPKRLLRMLSLLVGGRLPMMAPFVHATTMFAPFYAAAREYAADLYIANDWPMLPLGVTLAQRFGGVCIYDCHELATTEYANIRKWRLFNLPYIRVIESRYVTRVAAILTVSDGIAERLQRDYGLADRPSVVRNVPRLSERASHPIDRSRIGVLYHGILAPGRGLEQLIISVKQWRPEFRLTIRGPGADAYNDQLYALAAAHGVKRFIDFAPSVAPERLIDEAAKDDIGVVAMPGDTANAMFALPNKFFEYIMAGLALCVTDLPEMASIMRLFDLGRLAAGGEASAIAAAVNGFTPEMLEHYRTNARRAARELNWQSESVRLIDICEKAAEGKR